MTQIRTVLTLAFTSVILTACANIGVDDARNYDAEGGIIAEDLSGKRAVEIYEVQPKDMSYVNFEPDIDYTIVQNDNVSVYEVKNRNERMSHIGAPSIHSQNRWQSLMSMWRGGLNVGSEIYDDGHQLYNE